MTEPANKNKHWANGITQGSSKEPIRRPPPNKPAWPSKPPNLIESFVPVLGPAWDAAYDFNHGKPRMGAVDVGFAAVDAIPTAHLGIWAVRAVKDGIERGFARQSMRWGAARERHRAADIIKKIAGNDQIAGDAKWQQGHHAVIPQNGWGKDVPDWVKNAAWNIKGLEEKTHQLIHRAYGGEARFNPVKRTWIGTPDHIKAGAAAVAGHIGEAAVSRKNEPPRGAH